ncbi:uncharacterized protein [Anabrus simplex]|uniref:uncharacterized protein n=1 Tax=Anabrus simplex TaxID=316456 RepID=UPI0035A3C3FB
MLFSEVEAFASALKGITLRLPYHNSLSSDSASSTKMNTRLLIAVIVLAVNVCSGRNPSLPVQPSCVCRPCTEPSITHSDCERLGGIPLHSYCNCCDTCEILVGEGASCKVTLGQFPYPKCNFREDLKCVDDVCRKTEE